MKQIKIYILFVLCSLFTFDAKSQYADSIRQNRLKPLIITAGATYALSMVALNELWYADHARSSFHFFNDNNEWKQVDKAGHFYAAFQISSAGYYGLKWAGLGNDKSLLYGSLASLLALSSVEVFDGFSTAYGASIGDFVANSAGIAFFYGQQKLWEEVRLHPKFSFQTTSYPRERPAVLGKNLPEELLKDYNGQTYWISVDLSRFVRGSKVPKWFNIALGYGAHDLIYAEDAANIEAGYAPRRQYYLAIDFDFNEYRTKSKLINTLLYIINMVHLPAPALEFSKNEFKFHYAY
ncbi:hypothetical protein C900_04103 [Fulvivirga imtechensis AK7]|uniref:DUF2279 domain-containing protein n=1 Tax=Fulvivirga imtechensis AK7 TaxID=1237149 RepID=L8JMG0_9BACT|nr:DUF2279 domain-containing protein [Fulvivirga imtechensis]ELR70106.1 hypothetical protein C900_04103 [Fulvivirga imtechensis AK7]